jgi:hypothetical protein
VIDLSNPKTVELIMELGGQYSADQKSETRLKNIRSTANRISEGKKVSGLGALKRLAGDTWAKSFSRTAAISMDKEPVVGLDRYWEGCGGFQCANSKGDTVQLSNFTAEIIEEITTDDGAERKKEWGVEATHLGKSWRFSVQPSDFNSLSWVSDHLPPTASIAPGRGSKEKVATATRLRSVNHKQRYVHQHLGWSTHEGAPVFLHADGAIGGDGIIKSVEVDLPGNLSRFVFPTVPTKSDPVACVSDSINVLGVAPSEIALPLLSAAYRAAMGEPRAAINIVGATGTRKTAIASLCQQHFGADMSYDNLPGNWTSTANALEDMLFLAADVPVVLDDYAPDGASADQCQRTAARIWRNQANRTGRQRLSRSAKLRPVRPPRALLIATSEDLPKGQSLAARMIVLEVDADSVDLDVLTDCQAAARNGSLAAAMRAFIEWMAPRRAYFVRQREPLTRRIARTIPSAAHARLADQGADLLLGWGAFLLFAQKVGAIPRTKRMELWKTGVDTIHALIAQQGQRLEVQNPVARFKELIGGALAAGKAHLASPDGKVPLFPSDGQFASESAKGPLAAGWRFRREEWEACGQQIGFIDGEDIFLLPAATYQLITSMGHSQTHAIGSTQNVLWKRLFEAGVLASTDTTRRRLRIRRSLGGSRQTVLHIKRSTLIDVPVQFNRTSPTVALTFPRTPRR